MSVPESGCSRTRKLAGLSFDICDLQMALDWALSNNLRMVVELDSYTDVEQYEELLSFYKPGCKYRFWSMWRTYEDIVAVQSMRGSSKQFPSMSGALESITQTQTKLPSVRRHWIGAMFRPEFVGQCVYDLFAIK